jgi:hypothetical protein
VQLAGVQLAGVQLAGVQLAGVQLAGVQLAGVQLAGVQLAGVQVEGVQVEGVQVEGDSGTAAEARFETPRRRFLGHKRQLWRLPRSAARVSLFYHIFVRNIPLSSTSSRKRNR